MKFELLGSSYKRRRVQICNLNQGGFECVKIKTGMKTQRVPAGSGLQPEPNSLEVD